MNLQGSPGSRLIVAVTLFLQALPVPAAEPTLDSYRRGLELVEQSLSAIGGEAALAAGITLHGEGFVDLATRRQGMSAADPGEYSLRESLTLDSVSGQAAYESDTHANADAVERLRYLFEPDRPLLLADFVNTAAYWLTGVDQADERQRYARMVPQLLLLDALNHRQTIRYLGRRSIDGLDRDTVAYSLPDGSGLSIFIDPGTRRPVAVEYLLDMPTLGDTTVRWKYDAWRDVAAIGAYPQGYEITLGGRMLKKVRYTFIRAGVDRDLLRLPDEFVLPAVPDGGGDRAATPVAPALPQIRELADGVYVVPNIRPGFHPLIVEFADFVAVVDAPSGWNELQQLPARNWVAGETSSSIGQRLLDVLQRDFPGKPPRFVVLTHHHSDHAGGIRPFVAAGATFIAAPQTLPVIERTVTARVSLNPDALSGREEVVKSEPVGGEKRIADAGNEMRVINVGANPHVEGMLVVWLPRQKLLFQSDLFTPAPLERFPDRARIPVMRWFVDWLDASALVPDQIRSMHGNGAVTPQQLDIIRTMPVDENPAQDRD